jgi:hypothetical protein
MEFCAAIRARHSLPLLCGLLMTAATVCSTRPAGCGEKPLLACNAPQASGGFILAIERPRGNRGKAYWRPNSQASPKELRLKTDHYLPMQVDAELRCDPGVKIHLRRLHRIVTIEYSREWYPIPLIPPSPEESGYKDYLALQEYGRRGGREKATGQAVFSPTDDEMIAPARLIFRWHPHGTKADLSLKSLEETGASLEEIKVTVNEKQANGRFVWREAIAAMQRYRAEGGQGKLVLTLERPNRRRTVVPFRLLSAAQDEALSKELAAWESETERVVRHIARATIFRRYGFYSEVAEEYRAALKSFPHSVHLREKAIIAERDRRNAVGAAELSSPPR